MSADEEIVDLFGIIRIEGELGMAFRQSFVRRRVGWAPAPDEDGAEERVTNDLRIAAENRPYISRRAVSIRHGPNDFPIHDECRRQSAIRGERGIGCVRRRINANTHKALFIAGSGRRQYERLILPMSAHVPERRNANA